LRGILQYFFDRGYITASFDSIYDDSLNMKAFLSIGNEYSMSMIRKGNVPDEILSQIRYKEKLYSGRSFQINDINKLTDEIITWCEDHGYPFAMVKLDSLVINKEYGVEASLNLNLFQQVTIDTIIVKGNSKLHRKFIRNYFNIKQGDLYNESRFRRMGEKLQDLPFVSIIRPHEVVFTDDKAKLILYLDKKRASQFDGILGIAPNDDVEGKLLLTGDIKLKLLSAFNRGELIDLNWRKLEAQSQDLRFHFNFPFIFNTPFGFDYQLQLFKKDTSYLTLSNHIGIQVLFNGYNHVKAFYENQTSNLLSTEGLEFATTLPEYADVTTNMYGLGMDYAKLDYRYNPSRGFGFDVDGAIGSKSIKRNSNVNQALYDSIALNSTLYRIQVQVQGFIPLLRQTTLMVGNRSGYIENKNLFDNELFRIGGLKTLRGFDEESITASAYSIFTLEFRYLFDLNSFFQVFFDGAYYERNANSGYFQDTPYGVGVGINFETRAGIFALSYAMGSRDGQPLQFKSAKVHFGLTARF
jgi:outer membrane protein assembly factor BamA